MTALAIAVHRRRVVLAADSLACHALTGAQLGRVSKIHALPHLRAVWASCGYGHVGRAFGLLPPMPTGATVLDVLDHLRPLLLMLADEASRKQPPMPGAAVVLAGVVGLGDEAVVHAYALRLAEAFEPIRLEPGRCYLLGEQPLVEASAPEFTTGGELLPAGGKQSPSPAPVIAWPELARTPVRLIELARTDHPGTVGGPIQSVLLTAESAFYTWGDDP